ncbi:hypothetical protein BGX28_009784 [Mortierella sp. GBA30]|nr:hypothetical protein BGX28_009784 [Mortierella sp. GBA30]
MRLPVSPTQPQEQQQQLHQQYTEEDNSWSHRTLDGHAVLNDDDDDAGNELLDTEEDEFWRPDADDEVEGTIEGEILEEEGDDDDDDDGIDGDEADALWTGVIQQMSALKSSPSNKETDSSQDLRGVSSIIGFVRATGTDEELLVEKAYHDGDFE